MSDRWAKLESERRRRDLSSAFAACGLFYCYILFLAYMVQTAELGESGGPKDVRVRLLSESEMQMMFPEAQQAAQKRTAQTPIPQIGSQTAKLSKRETLLSRAAPQPLTSDLPAPSELERRPVDPESWEVDRPELAEKRITKAEAVALPDPVNEVVQTVADRKPEPILHDIAAVQQKEGIQKTSADMPKAKASPVRGVLQLLRNLAAPKDVVRQKTESGFELQAERSPDAISGDGEQKMAKKIMSKKDQPIAQVAAAYADGGARPDLPEVASALPKTWEGARSGHAVAEQYQVQAGSVALPAVAADNAAPAGNLSGKVAPVEAAVSDVRPGGGGVSLKHVEVAGPSGGAAKPVSSKAVVASQTSVAPSADVTRQQVRMDAPAKSSKTVDGLQAPAPAAPARLARQGIAVSSGPSSVPLKESSKEASAAPSSRTSAVPASAPDKWVDASGGSARPAMAERATIEAAGAVDLPTSVQEKTEGLLSAATTANYSEKIEAVAPSKFDFLTLSEQAAQAAGSASMGGNGDGSGERRLLRSEQPAIPEWYEQKGIDSVGTFRIRITAEGNVEMVEVEKTTGFKDIDAGWISAIMNWKYEKSDAAVTRLVKVRIELRK